MRTAGGHGSWPNAPNGWHRARRRRPSHVPRIAPWVTTAWDMYSEQDGSNRQLPVNSGDRTALYAAISPRTVVTATRPCGLWLFAVTTGEGACVIGLKAGKGRIEHFPARHDDDVESRWRFQSSEQLTGETLRPVPHDRRAKLPGCRHPESTPCASVRGDEQCHEPAA